MLTRSSHVPHQRFTYFQQGQYYLKIIVFLLPKFHHELERDQIISRIIHQMLTDGFFFAHSTNLFCFSRLENIVTLELRLTCSLVWHLLQENEQLSFHERISRMKNVTEVLMSRLTLYFGLIKTTMINQIVDGNVFTQLLEEILAFKT